jgi:hypothetical protein
VYLKFAKNTNASTGLLNNNSLTSSFQFCDALNNLPFKMKSLLFSFCDMQIAFFAPRRKLLSLIKFCKRSQVSDDAQALCSVGTKVLVIKINFVGQCAQLAQIPDWVIKSRCA